MSQEETMRLAAEVVDKWSGPLRAMNKAMREASAIARGTHGAGEKSVTAHDKAYRELHNTINKVRNTVSSALTPTMATLGIATLSVGSAIASVVASVKKLGDSYYQIQDASKRAGLSAQNIDALTVAFENLGIAPDAARSGLSNLGELLDKTSRRVPEAIQHWNALGGAWQLLGAQLQGLSRSDQLSKITEFLSTHPMSVDQRRKFWSDILAAPELTPLATKSAEQIRKALTQGLQFEKGHPYDPAQAEKINDAFIKLRTTLQGVERDFGNAFGDATVKLMSGVGYEVKSFTGWIIALHDDIEAVGDIIKNDFLPKVGSALDQVKNSAQWAIFSGKATSAIGPHPVSLQGFKDQYMSEEKQSIYEGTLRALREWWNTNLEPSGAHGGEGGGAGLTFRQGIRGGSGIPGGSGAGAGVDVMSSAVKGNKRAYMTDMAKQLADAGYPRTAIAGIMGNVGPESAWNPNTRHPDQTNPRFRGTEAVNAHGLFQEGGDEWNNYSRWLKENHPDRPWQDPHSQTEFLISRLNSSQYAATKRALMNARLPGDAALQFQGGKGWGYLRPGRPTGGARVNDANSIYQALPQLLREDQGGAPADVWNKGTTPLDLLKLGKQSGLMGGAQGFKSDASLRIDVNAPPGSIKTRLAHNGFEDVQFNRGLQMANASQTG